MNATLKIATGIAAAATFAGLLYFAIHKSIDKSYETHMKIQAPAALELAETKAAMDKLTGDIYAQTTAKEKADQAARDEAYKNSTAGKELERLKQEDLKALAK